MKVAIQTFGCKVNQYESQAMELLLKESGHELVSADEIADAYIVNSCTVTATSDRKARQAIHRIRRMAPEAVVALCGCYPQVSREDTAKLDVDLLSGTGDRAGFLHLLVDAWEKKRTLSFVDDALKRRDFEKLPGGALGNRTRAMLKVEDGCSNFCAYCIIPYARGPVRSLPLKAAEEEAGRLDEEGYREIVLTGIELSSWGQDLSGEGTLTDLIERVCRAAPRARIRLGSLEPNTVTEQFCESLAQLPNLCQHFHLSLQSGSDEVLRRMRRKYDTKRFLRSVGLLREYFPNPGITTDLIVGFPGETEEEFRETLLFLERCRFSSMHIFPYSPRAGTKAAAMEQQLTNKEKAARGKRAEEIAFCMEAVFIQSLVGYVLEVLFEEEQNGLWRGHSRENVLVSAEGDHLGKRTMRVKVTEAGKKEAFGHVLDEVN